MHTLRCVLPLSILFWLLLWRRWENTQRVFVATHRLPILTVAQGVFINSKRLVCSRRFSQISLIIIYTSVCRSALGRRFKVGKLRSEIKCQFGAPPHLGYALEIVDPCWGIDKLMECVYPHQVCGEARVLPPPLHYEGLKLSEGLTSHTAFDFNISLASGSKVRPCGGGDMLRFREYFH